MRIVALLAISALTLGPVAAVAQGLGAMNGPSAATGGLNAPPSDATKALPPPAAIPGSRSRPDVVVPLKGGTGDLPPTEALFDAINRGDILTARDSINRGADLDGTNLLGLTPIELSVDLGRNDISFLLLSLRGATAGARSPVRPDTDVAAVESKRGRHGATANAVPPQATRVKSTSVAESRDIQAPKLFAQDGGAPIPAAGFLGFDRH